MVEALKRQDAMGVASTALIRQFSPAADCLAERQNQVCPMLNANLRTTRDPFCAWSILLWSERSNEFFKPRIAAQRIEHWIEAKQRRSERHIFSQRTVGRHRK